MKSYLCQRLQKVEVASARSQWQILQKGVPQGSLLGLKKEEGFFNLNIGDELIQPMSLVKLLGVLIDDNLSFNENVFNLCVKAARQTNALRRIVKCISQMNIPLMYFRHLCPQISTIVILCVIFFSNRSTY